MTEPQASSAGTTLTPNRNTKAQKTVTFQLDSTAIRGVSGRSLGLHR